MEIVSLTTGSWFPRTKMHLKEYFDFMRDGKTHPKLDGDLLKIIRKGLSPRNVQYVGGPFDIVSAELDGISCQMHEDGLLTLSVSDVPEDIRDTVTELRSFHDDRVYQMLTNLFRLGAPTITYSLPSSSRRPVVILAKDADEIETRKLCAELDDEVHYVARHTDRTVYYARRVIVIVDESGGAGTTRHVITNLILSREYEHRLKLYFELHRVMWENISDIQERSSIPQHELPAIRDNLLNYRRDMAIIRARIAQMPSYIDDRKSQADELGLGESLRAVEAYRFDKLTSATDHIMRLWDMLEEYLEATIQITGLLYQENLQKEINIEQFIFLIGSVAGVIALGAISGASFMVFGRDGQPAFSGSLLSFDAETLIRFGGFALIVSLVFFFGIRPTVRLFQRIKPTSLLGKIRRSRFKEEPSEKE